MVRARSGGKAMTDFITLAMQAGGTPTHHARNCAWAGYLWARVWAPPEIAEIWYLLAARMQVECERIDALQRIAPLEELFTKAADTYKAMTPEQRAEMHRAQAASWARAEAGFGSDADEAAYRDAFRRGDGEALARINAESAARVKVLQERNEVAESDFGRIDAEKGKP